MSAEQHARAMARDRRAQRDAEPVHTCNDVAPTTVEECPACTAEAASTAPPARVGGVLVQSDSWPSGAWGWGATEADAVAQWKRHGGRGARIVYVIDPFWSGAHVDQMGQVWADVTDPASVAIPRRERPRVIRSAERVGPRGKREVLDLDA